MNKELGSWAFLVGVALAVIGGFVWVGQMWATWVLLLLGLVVGLMNITAKEETRFLVAVVALAIVSTAGQALDIAVLRQILSNLVTFAWPAGIVVAVKALWSMGKGK